MKTGEVYRWVVYGVTNLTQVIVSVGTGLYGESICLFMDGMASNEDRGGLQVGGVLGF